MGAQKYTAGVRFFLARTKMKKRLQEITFAEMQKKMKKVRY
jgi:hypothetical protein